VEQNRECPGPGRDTPGVCGKAARRPRRYFALAILSQVSPYC
jgi:hypothetical protein